MKLRALAFLLLLTVGAMAANRPNFTGSWTFNAERGKNIGMMSQVKMTQTIQQTDSSLDVLSHSTFQGSDQDLKTHYDLTGKPVVNESPMAGPSETVSRWDGDKLVTSWTSQSAVAGGERVVRFETRLLSADGNTMTIESVRGSNAPMIMVFDKRR